MQGVLCEACCAKRAVRGVLREACCAKRVVRGVLSEACCVRRAVRGVLCEACEAYCAKRTVRGAAMLYEKRQKPTVMSAVAGAGMRLKKGRLNPVRKPKSVNRTEWYEAQKLLELSQPATAVSKKASRRRASGVAKFTDAVAEWSGDEWVWPSDALRALLGRDSTEPLPAAKLLSALRTAGLLTVGHEEVQKPTGRIGRPKSNKQN